MTDDRSDPGEVETLNGEVGLLGAVLLDAIRIYCRAVVTGATESIDYAEVQRWIFRDDPGSLFSFVSLCDVFSLDPGRLRRALRRFRFHPDPTLVRLSGAMRGQSTDAPRSRRDVSDLALTG